LGKQLITGLEPGQVGSYVLLCGEPERVPRIAAGISSAKMVAQKREFHVHTGNIDGAKVTVASTGIGGPSTAILMEELINLGAKTFIRIGTSGAIAMGSRRAISSYQPGRPGRWHKQKLYLARISGSGGLRGCDGPCGFCTKAKVRFDVGICLSVDGFYSENKVLRDGKVAPMSNPATCPRSWWIDCRTRRR